MFSIGFFFFFFIFTKTGNADQSIVSTGKKNEPDQPDGGAIEQRYPF